MNVALHWLFRGLQDLFLIGLVGCALVVVISWVSIFKSGFSHTDEETQKPSPTHSA